MTLLISYSTLLTKHHVSYFPSSLPAIPSINAQKKWQQRVGSLLGLGCKVVKDFSDDRVRMSRNYDEACYAERSRGIPRQMEQLLVDALTDLERAGSNASSFASKDLKRCIEGLSPLLLAMALVATPIAEAATMDSMAEKSGTLYTLADGSMGDWFGGVLFSAGQQANVAVQDQLSALSVTSLAVIFGAGLVTSLSPCTLSVLPLTLGYIGAFGSGKSRTEVIGNSIAFAMGLATTLALLGVAASFAGKAYGQIGQGLPVAASVLAVVMGLNLLEVIELQLPSFFDSFDPRSAAANFPSSVQAYLAGLTFALAASPCSTPVLASILGYVASTRNPVIGGSLLLTYTTGYVAPLLLAASFAGALQSLLSFRKFSAWINPASGALLLGGGVYTLLDRLFPATMAM